jgi:hypothetical protein
MKENRTIAVDFGVSPSQYRRRHAGTPWFLALVIAVMRFVKHVLHREDCVGAHRYTRHSTRFRWVHRLHGRAMLVPISQIRCLDCGAVFTVLPSFVLRHQHYEAGMAQAMLECNLIMNVSYRFQALLVRRINPAVTNASPMALWHLMRWLGTAIPVTTLLLRLGLKPPVALLEDEKFVSEAGHQTYIAAIVSRDILWWVAYLQSTDEAAMSAAFGGYRDAVAGLLTEYSPDVATVDGHAASQAALTCVFPGLKLQECQLHAQRQMNTDLATYRRQHPEQDAAVTRIGDDTWELLSESASVTQFSQRLRRMREYIAKRLPTPGLLVARLQKLFKKRLRLLQHLKSPEAERTSTSIDQVFKWLDRKYFQMQSLMSEVGGSAFSNAWAIARNFWQFMRGAKRAGRSPVEINGVNLSGKSWLEVVNLCAYGAYRQA